MPLEQSCRLQFLRQAIAVFALKALVIDVVCFADELVDGLVEFLIVEFVEKRCKLLGFWIERALLASEFIHGTEGTLELLGRGRNCRLPCKGGLFMHQVQDIGKRGGTCDGCGKGIARLLSGW